MPRLYGPSLCVRNSYGKPNIVGGGRWGGASRIRAIYLNHFQRHFNGLGKESLARLVSGSCPTAWPLRLGQAEAFPRTSPLPLPVDLPTSHTRQTLGRGGRLQSRKLSRAFLLLQVQPRHM